ncbi:hypothetical protein DY037_05720 [Apilactobacillus micheneri]|uniref:hypothetical protein n=1 Tax=Apilactobacillus micheneri TaxID=1899430 RepID=UPI0011263DE4|nr:hypothetical protein [Apilactobacillus micheneri]TPR49279.1 hypothetical protein DY037_05720 [Apilactobacillus micheneri]
MKDSNIDIRNKCLSFKAKHSIYFKRTRLINFSFPNLDKILNSKNVAILNLISAFFFFMINISASIMPRNELQQAGMLTPILAIQVFSFVLITSTFSISSIIFGSYALLFNKNNRIQKIFLLVFIFTIIILYIYFIYCL